MGVHSLCSQEGNAMSSIEAWTYITMALVFGYCIGWSRGAGKL